MIRENNNLKAYFNGYLTKIELERLEKKAVEEIDWKEVQNEKIRDEWGSWGFV
jgi:hypothetical protein